MSTLDGCYLICEQVDGDIVPVEVYRDEPVALRRAAALRMATHHQIEVYHLRHVRTLIGPLGGLPATADPAEAVTATVSANVRCGGAPAERYPDGVERCPGWPPCGWKGERLGLAHPMWLHGQGLLGPQQRRNAEWVAAVTAKPCPRCGGQVELHPAQTKEVAR